MELAAYRSKRLPKLVLEHGYAKSDSSGILMSNSQSEISHPVVQLKAGELEKGITKQHKDTFAKITLPSHGRLTPIAMEDTKCAFRLAAYRDSLTSQASLPALKAPPTVGKYRHRAKVIPICSMPATDLPGPRQPPAPNNQLLREMFIRQRNQTSPGFDDADVQQVCDRYSILRYLASSDDRILTPKEARQGSSYRGGALHYSDAPSSKLSPRAPHCTRRTGRKHKKRSGADRMIWITRLGTWIRENEGEPPSYFHLGHGANITSKHHALCCPHHDFYHYNLNWDVRNRVPTICPRFYLHHHQRAHATGDNKQLSAPLKPIQKRKPLTVPRDPFTTKNDRKLKKPWLKFQGADKHEIAAKTHISFELPSPNDKQFQWMVDNATMTDESLSDVFSIPISIPTYQSRVSTPTTYETAPISHTSPVLVAMKNVIKVDKACNPISFTPESFARESTLYTPETEYSVDHENELQPTATKITDYAEDNKLSADLAKTARNAQEEESTTSVSGEMTKEMSDSGNSSLSGELSGELEESIELETHEHVETVDSLTTADDFDKQSDFDIEAESTLDSYAAVILSEAESSMQSRGSSPIQIPTRRKPPPPRRKPKQVDLPTSKGKIHEEKQRHQIKKGTPLVPLPNLIERPGSVKSHKSNKSIIEIHTPSPTPSRRSRGKVVRDKAILEEMRRIQQAEERRKKARDKFNKMKNNRNVPPPPSNAPNLDEWDDDDFLRKYCILNKEKLEAYKRVFAKQDRDDDGFISCEDSIKAARKLFPNGAINEDDIHYVYRLLEMSDYNVLVGNIDFKLFAIIVSLMQKISTLDDFMRNLIAQMDFSKADVMMWKARELFRSHVDNEEGNTISMEKVWVELHAGGISRPHEKQVRRALQHLKHLDVLDFMTYLPLFVLTHSTIVSNPLEEKRTI